MIKNKKLKILVRVDGGKSIGLGHVYNMITVLSKFRNNEILILMNKKNSLGKEKTFLLLIPQPQPTYTLSPFSSKNL